MATQRQQLNSSSLDDASPLSRTKSPRKTTKKPGSSVIKRIWSEEDELTVLKGLVDYRVEKSLQPNSDWDAFYHFLGDSIVSKFSKEQLLGKISKLKKKFLQGNIPDSEAYEFSSLIWGQNESQFAAYAINKQKDIGDETTLGEDEQVDDVEPLKENAAEKSDFDDKSAEKETTGEEINDNEVVADELSYVRDAYETLVSQDLSSHEKKMQLENLMKIENGKRKEISEEWKELCAEKAKLRLKKLRLAVRLAEALNDN